MYSMIRKIIIFKKQVQAKLFYELSIIFKFAGNILLCIILINKNINCLLLYILILVRTKKQIVRKDKISYKKHLVYSIISKLLFLITLCIIRDLFIVQNNKVFTNLKYNKLVGKEYYYLEIKSELTNRDINQIYNSSLKGMWKWNMLIIISLSIITLIINNTKFYNIYNTINIIKYKVSIYNVICNYFISSQILFTIVTYIKIFFTAFKAKNYKFEEMDQNKWTSIIMSLFKLSYINIMNTAKQISIAYYLSYSKNLDILSIISNIKELYKIDYPCLTNFIFVVFFALFLGIIIII